MRVGVDARHLDAGRGIAVYVQGMLGALTEDAVSLLVPGRAPLGPAARELGARPNVRVVRTRAPGRAVHGAAAVTGVPTVAHLLGDDLDVVWVPALAPVSPGDVPYVLTVHDRSFEERPGDFTAYERLWHAAARPRRLARRAARVVTDTAAVRDELRAAWGLEGATVVAPGLRPVSPGAAPDERYVLFVGALEPRKDPAAVARAAATAGIPSWFAGTGRLAGDVQAAGGRLLGRVGDAELDGLLAGALALALPSHLEGFGFPPLEAALCGTPSIVTDLPVLRETLGDEGALFVRPGDHAALAAALARLRDEPALRERVATRASERARAHTWERAARELRAVLAEAAA
jgi:glycosyltransferase involved in cell wall biosynthesis